MGCGRRVPHTTNRVNDGCRFYENFGSDEDMAAPQGARMPMESTRGRVAEGSPGRKAGRASETGNEVVEGDRLALRELEAFAGAGLAGFFPLFHSRIAP